MTEVKVLTERLLLRNLKPEDVSSDYVNWLNNPLVNKYLSCAGKHQTMDSCVAYVQSYRQKKDAVLVGIFLKENAMHIGNMTLSIVDLHNKSAAVGISVGRSECTGKGFAREALCAITIFCFDKLKIHRLWAGINVNNLPSINLFMKCGFKIDALLRESSNINGELQDSYIVSILKREAKIV